MDQTLNQKIEQYLSEHRDSMVEDLFTLVKIPSVRGDALPGMPYGKECARALDAAFSLCEKQGMRTENCGYYCGSALWAAPGVPDGAPELGIAAHLDVVPAGDGWSGKPFEPFLRDGFAIGRGVCDNKNGVITGLYAVRCIRDLGIPMRHALRLIFGCAEETGMDDLPHYFENHPAPAFTLVPDTDFPVCHGEKGVYTAELIIPTGGDLTAFEGGVAPNVVPDKASASLTAQDGPIHLQAQGISSHASRPEGSKNAIRELALLIQARPDVSQATRKAMDLILETLSDHYGGQIGIAFEDEPSGKLTCIAGLASLKDGAIHLDLNIRYPVTHNAMAITEGLERFARSRGCGFSFGVDDKPSYLPADHPAIVRLSRVYADVTGRQEPPYVMGGGTYARHIPNAVSFGPDFPGGDKPCPAGHGGCHEPDECQSIQGLMEAVKIYIHALLELDNVL